ncbi:MAG: hypothetical protein KC519_11245 [Anaerolineae bacterium]|nr:hypothetical protein [Anaerolineae bacterium]
MNALQTDNLDQVLAAIREHWERESVVRNNETMVLSHLPTGFNDLDLLLGGGFRLGGSQNYRATYVGENHTGIFSSGSRSKVGTVVNLDVDNHSDADFLMHLGTSRDDILLVQLSLDASLDLMRDVTGSRIPRAILFGPPEIVPPADAE